MTSDKAYQVGTYDLSGGRKMPELSATEKALRMHHLTRCVTGGGCPLRKSDPEEMQHFHDCVSCGNGLGCFRLGLAPTPLMQYRGFSSTYAQVPYSDDEPTPSEATPVRYGLPRNLHHFVLPCCVCLGVASRHNMPRDRSYLAPGLVREYVKLLRALSEHLTT